MNNDICARGANLARVRRMTPFRPLLIALTVGSSSIPLVVSTEARAESAVAPPRCKVNLLPAGTDVPGNLPALVIDDTATTPGLTATIENVVVSGGASPVKLGIIADPKTPKVSLLVPSTNDLFESGVRYDISYTVKCSAAVLVAPGASSFTVGMAVALPTTIGTVTELADGTASLARTPELAAFERTSRFEAFVDGVSIGMTPYGAVVQEPVAMQLAPGALYVGTAAIGKQAGTSCAAGGNETHEVKLVAHVAGTTDDTAPLTFSLGIDCSKYKAATATLPDGGGDDRGASGGGTDGGCAVAGNDPYGSVAGIFGVGAGVAVLFRRRRRAR